MAYELATIASPTSTTPQVQREEKTVSAFSDANDRIAKALAKRGENDAANGAQNTNESVEADSSKSGASLPLSPQLAALARKEQKFRQEQQALRAKEIALEQERKEIADLKALKAKLEVGDYSDADKFIDYEKLTQHKLGKDPRTEELDKVRSEVAELKAAQEKDVEERFKSAVNQRRVAVKTLINANDEFVTIRELKAEEAVVQHIIDTWENDDVELTPEDAAKEVEAALLEKATKWTSLSKLKAQATAVPEKKELPPLKTEMKTLTNSMASTGEIKRPQKPLHMMTEQERYAEARRRYEEKQRQGMV